MQCIIFNYIILNYILLYYMLYIITIIIIIYDIIYMYLCMVHQYQYHHVPPIHAIHNGLAAAASSWMAGGSLGRTGNALTIGHALTPGLPLVTQAANIVTC